MERSYSKITSDLRFWIYIYFIAGVLWHIIDSTRPIVVAMTPFTLFLSSALVIYFSLQKSNLITVIWLVCIFILTLLIEIFGVQSGLIFGEYVYGDVLGIQFFEVPILIGLNWTIVIIGVNTLVNRFSQVNIYFKCLFAALLAVLFDLVMEPAAIKLNYWQWKSTVVPFKNYLSWFLIAGIFSFAGFKLQIKLQNDMIIHYLIAQFIFFLLLLFLF